MQMLLIVILVIDLIVTAAVVAYVIRRRQERAGAGLGSQVGGTSGAGALLSNMREMATFANEKHPRIGEYVRANWSGMPEQLPAVLGSLLDELEREARAKALPLDRDLLKVMIATSLRQHRIGRGSEVGKALERVA